MLLSTSHQFIDSEFPLSKKPTNCRGLGSFDKCLTVQASPKSEQHQFSQNNINA